MFTAIAIILCGWFGPSPARAITSTPEILRDWAFHTPRFRPVFDGFTREREFAPVTSFGFAPGSSAGARVFRVRTEPSVLRPGLTAEVTFRDDDHGIVVTQTRVGERALAEYLYLNVLVLILDRRPVPRRVLVALPWHDPERRAIFAAAAGDWRAGWVGGDFGRALTRFGFKLSTTDARGRAIFWLDPCAILLTTDE